MLVWFRIGVERMGMEEEVGVEEEVEVEEEVYRGWRKR